MSVRKQAEEVLKLFFYYRVKRIISVYGIYHLLQIYVNDLVHY